jgi:hypothetical protein
MNKLILLLAMGAALTTQALFAQVPSYVPTNGLVGYWPFSGNANDQTPSGNNGTVNGATLTTDRFGNSNSSYEFNGTSNIINFGSSQSLINLSNFTYSLWINRSSNCADDAIIISNYGGNWEGNLLFGKLIGSGNAQIRLHKLNQIIGSETDIVDNQWINLVAVKDLNSIKIYKNGVLIQATDLTNFVSINNTSFPFVIGGGGWGNSNYFMGKVDDLGVWNRALSQSEITSMYNGLTYSDTCNAVSGSLTNGLVGYWPFCGNANDDSGNGNNGTNNGATLTTDRFGNSNSAYSFDGNDWIEVFYNQILNFGTNSFTLSCWSTKQGNNTFQHLITRNYVTQWPNAVGNYALRYENNTVVLFSSGNMDNITNGILVTSPQNNLNNWNHFVGVFNATNQTMQIYMNGNIIATGPINPNLQNNDSIGNMYFGVEHPTAVLPSGPQFLTGKLDDIGIWNRALTQEEITNLYNTNQCITNITVTDTLVINVGQLSFNDPVTWANSITISPNPASTQININFNNISNLNGGTLKVINSLGQEVATTPITTSGTNSTMQLATWGGTGMYFVQIINPQGQIVDIKKIILQ